MFPLKPLSSRLLCFLHSTHLPRARSTLRSVTRFFSIPLASFILDADDAQARQPESPQSATLGSAIGQWWAGPYAMGDGFGGRTFLEDHGLKLGGSSTAIYYGVPTKDLNNNSVFCYNLILTAEFDFGKMLGLQGLKGNAGIQWETGETFLDFRDGVNGAGIAFSPTAFTGWWKWRLKPIVLTYVTPELFHIKEFFTLSGGWHNPQNYFIQQSAANLFQNYAFFGGPLVANGILFDGNYVAWGGYTKVKPADWAYIQAGLWAAVPNALNWRNRGVYFALPSQNGLFFMGETGVTPQFGSKRLPGKYAFGSYYWSLPCPSFCGTPHGGRFGFYWQADQMLYREPTPPSSSDASRNSNCDRHSNGKMSASSTATVKEKLSPQGLSFFSLFLYAPQYNNLLPFFFRTGLVYKGLIPTRDQDDLGIGFAFGHYGQHQILANPTKDKPIRRTNEALIEVDYRLQINRWLFAQPFLEYIIQPNGSGQHKDALVVGIASKVTF